MKDRDLHNILTSFDIDVAPVHHQKYLKDTLITLMTHQQTQSSRKISPLQTFYFYIFSMKHIAFTGSVTAAMALGVFLFTTFSPSVFATIAVNNGIAQLQQISQKEISDIQSILGSDPIVSLQEAKKSSDLVSISKEDFVRQSAGQKITGMIQGTAQKVELSDVDIKKFDAQIKDWTMNVVPAGVGTGGVSISTPVNPETATADFGRAAELNGVVTYLRYTDIKGQIVFLGLDKNDVPMMKQIILK